jgi:hypothetical protein
MRVKARKHVRSEGSRRFKSTPLQQAVDDVRQNPRIWEAVGLRAGLDDVRPIGDAVDQCLKQPGSAAC